MKDPLIEELQKKRDAARFTVQQTSTDAAWHEFRSVRNKLKSAIRTARKAFIEKALYLNKSREVLESHPQSAKAKCKAPAV